MSIKTKNTNKKYTKRITNDFIFGTILFLIDSKINKQDKKRSIEKQENEICVSALSRQNIEQLKEKIFQTIIKEKIDFNGVVVTNERQLQHLKNASSQVDNIFKEKDQSLEILSMLIKKVWNELGKITGETENEDIISMIFSKFCVGK